MTLNFWFDQKIDPDQAYVVVYPQESALIIILVKFIGNTCT